MNTRSEIGEMIAKDHDLFLIHDNETGNHIVAIINDEDWKNRFVVGAVSFTKEQLTEFRDAINAALGE